MTILAVDNNQDQLDQLVEHLAKIYEGETIVAFTDPLMAVKYSFNNSVNMVFTDVAMRGMDGSTLVKGISTCNKGIKTFFLIRSEEEVVYAKQVKASGCLLKPITEEGIRNILLECGELEQNNRTILQAYDRR